ncbi:amidohydrolase family protein [Pseudohalioglobus sediminis]|uniref:Amidohydrolase family protein n=1 Tax=Pseudohalioglobus sediminis TaxID=2606449 RepID=A0A5B0X766_9GAMM|nr:amidohydrolase family protein [Pseudohalioglobus sediminis]KAA1194307.1 amidohydrolase family protein [Pseudohalioglobus sediminis]
MYDLLIRNAQIVDGTGRAAFHGNLAVRDGKIAAVGEVDGEARKIIDADGKLLTPGWVDVHSHMDGQATWDPLCSPAANHGITTLIMGNCGVGFAPCEPNDAAHDRLIAVMEDVEDIPGSALHEGVSWDWESFPEYLDAVERFPRAIDVGAQVPHCAVRTYVMGDRGTNNEKATAEDISKMATIVREGIEAGALGFTTSRTELHTTREDQAMPGTYADEDELLGIGKAIGELGGKGIYGVVSDWTNWEQEMDWMKRLSIDNQCQINFVLFFREEADWPRVKAQLDYVREAAKEGARLIPHVGARPVNILLSWDGTINPFSFHANYAALSILSHEERLAELRKPEVRAAILAEDLPLMGDEFMDTIIGGYDKLYELGNPPNYEPAPEDSIAARAAAAGVPPQELCYDLMMQRDGKNVIYFPCFGYSAGDLSRQMALLEDESTVLSLADTGAHCGVLCDASVPTQMLSFYVRDRQRGHRLALEQAVKMQTMETARCVGLEDRGTLEVGMKADLNLIDFDALQLEAPEIIFDLPAGGRRMFQGAKGYLATIVSGEVIMENGEPTGAVPGELIRGTRAAPVAA